MNDENNTQTQGDGTSFGDLLKKFFIKAPKIGDIIDGEVISVDNGAIRIDVNGLTTGVVRGDELFSESKEYADLKPGDKVQATVLEEENENGEMELSFREAGQQLVWDRLKKYMEDGIILDTKIMSANKGGLMMQVEGVAGFMPVSQLSPDNYPRIPGGDKGRILEILRSYVGKGFKVKVIDINPKEEKLILSEKAVWEDEQKNVLDSYKIGDEVEGEVSALTSFGAFIKFGDGLEGLVHISEIAWQRIDHPKDVLKVGDKVKAQIIDLNKSKIYLSVKRLVDDPWKSVKDKYKVGEVVEGEVHKVENFGLMVKLDDDIHGLAHISELSNSPVTEAQVKERFKIGEKHKFEIVSIEPAEHRLGLKVDGVKGKEVERVESKKDKVSNKDESILGGESDEDIENKKEDENVD